MYLIYLGIGAVMGALFSGIIFAAAFLDMRNLHRMQEDHLEAVIEQNNQMRISEMNAAHRRTAAALINMEK
jgi:hypothetical protein